MSLNRDSYYTALWSQVLDYLRDNGLIEPNILETFFRKSWIYSLNDEQGTVLTDSVITQQILMRSSKLISDALLDILDLQKPVEINVELEDHYLQKQEEPVKEGIYHGLRPAAV